LGIYLNHTRQFAPVHYYFLINTLDAEVPWMWVTDKQVANAEQNFTMVMPFTAATTKEFLTKSLGTAFGVQIL
jgi:hypothetical protein